MYVTLVSGMGWHVQDLLRAARRIGMPLVPIVFSRITALLGSGESGAGLGADPATATGAATGAGEGDVAGGLDWSKLAGIMVRMMPPGSLEQVVFRMDVLHRCVDQGIPVINSPRAVEIAVDKYLCLARLDRAGILVPPTWCGESPDAALEAFERLGGDVIVKPLFGSEGRGMFRVDDPELAWRTALALSRLGHILYFQKYLPGYGYDYRLFVLGDRVLGGMRRHAPQGDWRTNIAQGGRAEAFVPEAALTDLALRAARAVGADVAGVDVYPARDGRLYLLEVNAVPGWKALGKTCGVDIAAEILDLLQQRASQNSPR